MTTHSTTPADETTLFLGTGWSDPLEAGIRDRIRDFIEELIEEELAAALGRGRYERRRHNGHTPAVEASDAEPLAGHRHGRWRRRSAMPRRSGLAVTWRRGLAWCRASRRPEANRASAGSPRRVMATTSPISCGPWRCRRGIVKLARSELLWCRQPAIRPV
jgi:hypothetical protein